MEEAHYDTPWEFKNRGLAALRQRPHSTSSPTPNSIGVATSPTNPNNRTNFSGASERSENASVSPPRSISNQQLVHVLHSPSSEQSPRQPLVNVKRTHFPAITASTSAASTPVPEHRRRRSEKIENSKTTITHDKKHDLNYPHVRNHSYGLEFDLTDKRRAISNQQKQRYKYDESHILHDGIDRVEAEKMLQSLDIGDFLLRRRPEGNLALSLKASDGVLHIKLEEREGRWVLGEGPSFSSINSCIRYYRKTELPIRGAEHILLRYPVMTPVKIN